MSALNDGGSAFPVPPERVNMVWDNAHWSYADRGMTLRDYFAGQALHGILMNYTTEKFGATEEMVARYAYRYADAMLAERARKEAQP